MTPRRWVEYIVAILLGNAMYFLLLFPALPRVLQHQPFRFDAGLVLDFLLCVTVYAVIRLGVAHARRWNERTWRRAHESRRAGPGRGPDGEISDGAGAPSDTQRSRRAPRG